MGQVLSVKMTDLGRDLEDRKGTFSSSNSSSRRSSSSSSSSRTSLFQSCGYVEPNSVYTIHIKI